MLSINKLIRAYYQSLIFLTYRALETECYQFIKIDTSSTIFLHYKRSSRQSPYVFGQLDTSYVGLIGEYDDRLDRVSRNVNNLSSYDELLIAA